MCAHILITLKKQAANRKLTDGIERTLPASEAQELIEAVQKGREQDHHNAAALHMKRAVANRLSDRVQQMRKRRRSRRNTAARKHSESRGRSHAGRRAGGQVKRTSTGNGARRTERSGESVSHHSKRKARQQSHRRDKQPPTEESAAAVVTQSAQGQLVQQGVQQTDQSVS